MPRNSQGQYFLPDGNPVVAGELVRAEWANSTLDDVANALTNSLDRAGAGGMTGQFKAASGTSVRPGVSFVEDPATGIYKESQGVLAISANGIKQAYATQNGLFVTTAPSDKMEVANKGYVDALASQATEIILSFGISKTPADLPTNGYIPANWDASGSPAFAVQFQAGQSAVYRPANTSDPLYNNVYVYVSTNTEATGWINIGTVAGPPGPQGEVGPMGPPGPQGPTGEQGPTGATGPLGPVGPTGAQGPQGPQGAKGDTGPAGQSVVIVGSFGTSKTPNDLPSSGFIPANWDAPGNPANDIQLVPGQALIYTNVPQSDPLYGHVYEFVGTGTGFDQNGWVDLGDIQGPAGPQGAQGPQGIQGNTGPQGPAGTDGATGPQGPQGVQGDPGAKGDAGSQGPQGIKGDTGPQGPQGPKGDTGATGPAGGVNSVNGLSGNVTLTPQIIGAAPLANPAFTGVPTAPTAGYTTSNDQIATTKFVYDWATNNTTVGRLASNNIWTGNNTWQGTGTFSGTSVTYSASTPVTFSGTTAHNGTNTFGGASTFSGLTTFSNTATFSKNPIITGDSSGTYALAFSPSSNNTYIATNSGGTQLSINVKNTTVFGCDTAGVNTNGVLTVTGPVKSTGYQCRSGSGGAYTGNTFNWVWASPNLQAWIDNTNVGTLTPSDYRIKQDVTTVGGDTGVARINQLRPVTYQIKDFGGIFVADGITREGFIAHELQAVIPSAVEGDKDAPNQIQSLKLDALCSVLVKAVQELSARVETLEAQVNK